MNKEKVAQKMENIEGHFYFSKKQQEILEQIGKDGYCSYYRTFGLTEGKIVEYAEMLPDEYERKESRFEDAVYLGFGEAHSFITEIEVENGIINGFINAKDDEERGLRLEELQVLNEYKTGTREYFPMWHDIIGEDEDG